MTATKKPKRASKPSKAGLYSPRVSDANSTTRTSGGLRRSTAQLTRPAEKRPTPTHDSPVREASEASERALPDTAAPRSTIQLDSAEDVTSPVQGPPSQNGDAAKYPTQPREDSPRLRRKRAATTSSLSGKTAPHTDGEAQAAIQPEPPSIGRIREWQAQLVAAIRQRNRCILAAGAFVRRAMGFRIDMAEAERKAITTRAAKVMAACKKGVTLEGDDGAVQQAVLTFVLNSMAAAAVWEPYEKKLRANMEAEAEKVLDERPKLRAFIDAVRGFTVFGLAVIIGEAGDIGTYRTSSRLWKRLGLAPKPCYAMETKAGDIAYAVPKRRRSAIWVLGDAMLKNQGKDEAAQYYRRVYDARRAHTATTNPDWTDKHSHLDGQRYMEKRLVRHVWITWRGNDIEAEGAPCSMPRATPAKPAPQSASNAPVLA